MDSPSAKGRQQIYGELRARIQAREKPKVGAALQRIWRRYWIVGIGLVLSAISFAGTRNLPDWFIAGLWLEPTAPCSRLQALNGLRVAVRVRSLTATFARQCIKIRTDSAALEQIGTPLGTYWVPEGTRSFLPYLLAEQAAGVYSSGSTRVRPGDIVLDGGANIGAFVRVALDAGAERVIAIEPAPENLECLRRNFEQEIADGRVIIYPKGIWNRNAVLPMRLSGNSGLNSFVFDHDGGRTVVDLPLTSIDELTTELRLPRVDYIKLDVEGAEIQAIEGAKGVLGRYRPRLAITTEHYPEDNVSIPRAVLAANSSYSVACGACTLPGGRIRPEVLHFR